MFGDSIAIMNFFPPDFPRADSTFIVSKTAPEANAKASKLHRLGIYCRDAEPQRVGPSSRVEYFGRGHSCEAAAAGLRHSRGPGAGRYGARLCPARRGISRSASYPQAVLRISDAVIPATLLRLVCDTAAVRRGL